VTDERPKPKYGELAPEGWVWQPPQQATPDADEPSASPAPAPAPSSPVAAASAARSGSGSGSAADGPQKPIAVGDVVFTVILLVIGFFATANTVSSLVALPSIIQEVLDVQKLDVTYTATTAGSILGIVGSVLIALLYALAVWLSVKAIRARRTAFYIPLAVAVLSFMLLFFVLILAFFADGAIVNAILDSSRRS